MKISFFNQLFLISKRCGLDHEVLSRALPSSALGIRLPDYYTKGGYPFGGKCLPKDLAAAIYFMERENLDPRLFEAVGAINREIAEYESYTSAVMKDTKVSSPYSYGRRALDR